MGKGEPLLKGIQNFSLVGLQLLFVAIVHSATFQGHIIGISDGDTVILLTLDHVQHKIRLAGIDAPEKAQPFGERSKQSLSDLVFNKSVTVETDKHERYGREVGKVLINGLDVNLVQVHRGFAWHYKVYEREQSPNDRKLYESAEQDARGSLRGLWRDATPVPPWEFRKAKRDHATE